ncbi:MAG: aminopeptidase P N-terminal domain-containing protein [Patescibacteria group bacterium]|nr:aminopeptidase P N-terminal domain-containing protein [Patescibacteria group bacterium]
MPGIVFCQTPEEFALRRCRLTEGLLPTDIVLVTAAEEIPRNGDVMHEYRQASNFYYLTGFEEPESALLLSPGKKLYNTTTRSYESEILFIPSSDSLHELWSGHRPGQNQVRTELRIICIRPIEQFPSLIEGLLPSDPTFYLDRYISSFEGSVPPLLIPLQHARNNLIPFGLKSLHQRIGKMREIKSSSEISLLRRAISITGNALREAMFHVKHGMYEYEIEALIEYNFRKQGSARTGFPSIIGSGQNSCFLHYDKNTRLMENGDFVVMDVGAEWQMYTADITRTIPVSGKFSLRQKELYNLVLQAQEKAIESIHPGITRNIIHTTAVSILSHGLKTLGLISDTLDYRKYYMHGSSHNLGLDVHDITVSDTLQAGMVITVEPGIYIREENIGSDGNDDILVTESGYEILSSEIPKNIEAIERMMNNK